MGITVEVCLDNIESLDTAVAAGAHRIELCSSLALGGLTPSPGFIKRAVEQSPVPIYPMVRHRAGDFVFGEDEIDIMVEDIALMKQLGAKGVVVGALTPTGYVDEEALSRMVKAADGMDVTFHRAFDLCIKPRESLETIINHGCSRILTSGQRASAYEGIDLIRKLHQIANGRISIMAGAGVHGYNVREIIKSTGVHEIHLSGKTTRQGRSMPQNSVKVGKTAECDCGIDVTDYHNVHRVVTLVA